MKFTLLQDGELYTPQPQGRQSLLLSGSQIAQVGALDEQKLGGSGLDCEVIDVTGCAVVPGLLDPHEHLIGAGGEEGFAKR